MIKRIPKFFRWIISIGILAFLIFNIDISEILKQFSGIDYKIIVLCAFILIFQVSLSSLKWKIIINADNCDVPYLFLLKSYFIGGFISLFLPSSFGGDIYRVISLKKYSGDIFQNTSSVLFDRMSGLFALTSISIISFAFFGRLKFGFWFLITYVFFVAAFFIVTNSKIINFIEENFKKIAKPIAKILKSFERYRKDKGTLGKTLLVSFIFQNNIVWLVKLYCISLGIDISLKHLYVVVPLIYLTEALPIAINGLGVREGAFVFFFLAAGNTKEEALAVSFLVITMRYLVSLLFGGSLFLETMVRFKGKEKIQSEGKV
jgi:uncharacterized protein (TIRG00374 family)